MSAPPVPRLRATSKVASYDALPTHGREKYGQIDGVPYLSPSQIRSLKSCQECFRRRYIEREPTPAKESLIVGGSVHVGLETGRYYIVDNGPEWFKENRAHVLAHVTDAAITEFNRQLSDRRDSEGMPLEVRWNKTSSEGAARDKVARVCNQLIPALLDNDAVLGLSAVEQRVWGLGLALDEDEAEWYRTTGTEPVFPEFGVMAIIDAYYATGWMEDCKTKGAGGEKARPSYYDQMQLTLYDLPWWKAGQPSKLRLDVLAMGREPEWFPWQVDITDEFRESVIRTVRWAADTIVSGRFDATPGPLCDFEHNLPRVQDMRIPQAQVVA